MMLRRTIRAITFAATLVIAAAAAVVIVSQTSWFHRWVRDYVVKVANQALHGKVAIRSLEGNWFTGVTFESVTLTVEGRPIVNVERVELSYNLLEFWEGGIPIDRVTLVAPVVHLRRTDRGVNLAQVVKSRPGAPSAGASAWDIGAVVVRNGTLTIGKQVVATAAVEVPRQLDDVNAVFAASRTRDGRVQLQIEDTSFIAHGLRLRDLSGGVAFARGNIRLDDVSVKTARSSIAMRGVLATSGRHNRVALELTAPNLDIGELAPILPVLSPYAEFSPSLHARAEGPLNRLAATFQVATHEGAVSADLIVDATTPGRRVTGEFTATDLNLSAFAPFSERSEIDARGNLDVELDGRRLTFDAQAEAFAGRIFASGDVTLPVDRRPARYDITGRATSIRPALLPARVRRPFGASGPGIPEGAGTRPISLEFNLTGRGRDFELRVDLADVFFAGAGFAPGTSIDIRRAGGTTRYHATGRVRDLNVERLANVVGLTPLQQSTYATDLNATFDLTTVQDTDRSGLTVTGRATLTDSLLFGVEFPVLRTKLGVVNGTGVIAATGRFSDVNTDVMTSEPAVRAHASGTVQVEAAVSDLGTPAFDWRTDVNARTRLDVTEANVGGVPVQSATLDATYRDQSLKVSTFELTGRDLSVTASGQLALDRAGESSLTYAIDTPPLSDLAWIDPAASGDVLLRGVLTGNHGEYRTHGSVSGTNAGIGDYGVLSVNGTYDARVPSLDPSRGTYHARLDLSQVRLGNRTLGDAELNATYEASRIVFDASVVDEGRRVEFGGRLALHPDHHEVHLRHLSLEAGATRFETPPRAEAAIRWYEDLLTVTGLKLVSEQAGSLTVEGSIGVDALQPLDIKAAGLPLELFDDLVLEGRAVGGVLHATAQVSGPLDSLSADVEFAVADGTVDRFAFERLAGSVVYASAERLAVDLRLDALDGASLTAVGTVPLGPGPRDRLDLRVEGGPVDLTAVAALTPEISNARGSISLDVLATGSYGDPHLNGWLDLKNGGFTVTALQSHYTAMDTRIRFEPHRIVVPEVTLHDDEGHVMRVAGNMAYHERRPGEMLLSIESNDFEVMDNRLGEIEVDTAVRVSGDVARPSIEGTVTLAHGTVNVNSWLDLLDERYPTRSTERSPSTAQGAGETANSLDPAIAVDIRLLLSEGLLVKGSDLRLPGSSAPVGLGDVNVTVAGDVQLRKPAGGPFTLVGRVSPVRGTYEFQGREFSVSSDGSISFAGLAEINPRLDLTATRVVTGVEARVHVGGRLRAPEIDLSSQPPLDEADILSLIVFNQPLNRLATGEQVSLARRAAGLAAGVVTSRLAESIAGAFDLDVLDFELGGAEFNPSLTVGEELVSGLYLKLRQQFGPASVSSAAIEYQLADWLRFEGELSEGDLGPAQSLLRRVERGGLSLIFWFSY